MTRNMQFRDGSIYNIKVGSSFTGDSNVEEMGLEIASAALMAGFKLTQYPCHTPCVSGWPEV